MNNTPSSFRQRNIPKCVYKNPIQFLEHIVAAEKMEKESNPEFPHVVIFPFPIQGHINSMLKLSEIFSLAGLKVTFFTTEQNHTLLVRFTDFLTRFQKYSNFQLQTVPDVLPTDHSRTGKRFIDVIDSLESITKPIFKTRLMEITPPVNCIIGDGILRFAFDVATELRIPIIHFRTISACSFWVYFCIPNMIDSCELPIKGKEDMDRIIRKVPGMETFLRCRDLPSMCRVDDVEDRSLLMMANETRQSARAQAFILNTFEDLEGPILSQIRNHCPKTYTIGPLHELLRAKFRPTYTQESYQSTNSLWQVDRSCITWLDSQPSHSVLYVSFGSITATTRDQLMELWHGIVNSKKRFLWVIRPGSVTNSNGDLENIPEELQEGPKENGYVVKWAPQEEVLSHKAIGGFLTHSGWNSTLESIVAGVPMICWPSFADQQVNSKFVSEIWKLGLDMKDVCDRRIVEKMVNDLMVDRREEFVRSSARIAELARKSASEGGSSYCNLKRLIEDIRLMSRQSHDN